MAKTDLAQIAYTYRHFSSNIDDEDFKSFIKSCIEYADKTKSQNFQDVFALHCARRLQVYPKNYYFVEIGATNGVDGSNTFMLENNESLKESWRGILVEPNDEYFNEMKKNRSHLSCYFDSRCVYNKSGETVDFLITDEPDLSCIKEYSQSDEHAVKRNNVKKVLQKKTITLYDLLEQYNIPNERINYLSIDTEGSELMILEKFFDENKNKYRIDTITVEHNYVADKRDKLARLLNQNNYIRVFPEMSRWDDFYVINTV